MKRGEYVLEILWSTGDLTETKISEAEKELIERHGALFILAKYSLEGAEDARPISYQVWDKEDNPIIPVQTEAVPA